MSTAAATTSPGLQPSASPSQAVVLWRRFVDKHVIAEIPGLFHDCLRTSCGLWLTWRGISHSRLVVAGFDGLDGLGQRFGAMASSLIEVPGKCLPGSTVPVRAGASHQWIRWCRHGSARGRPWPARDLSGGDFLVPACPAASQDGADPGQLMGNARTRAYWRCCVSVPAMNRPGSLRLDTGAGRERPPARGTS